jgi:hypothetical protein
MGDEGRKCFGTLFLGDRQSIDRRRGRSLLRNERLRKRKGRCQSGAGRLALVRFCARHEQVWEELWWNKRWRQKFEVQKPEIIKNGMSRQRGSNSRFKKKKEGFCGRQSPNRTRTIGIVVTNSLSPTPPQTQSHRRRVQVYLGRLRRAPPYPTAIQLETSR